MRILFRIILLVTAGLLVVTVFQVALLRFVDPPYTVRMVWQSVVNCFNDKTYRRPAYHWKPLGAISVHLRQAVLAAEDQRFTRHNGFDFIEVRAAAKDLLRDNRLRGASTISMQTARTVYLMPNRTFLRKILEAYYTALIELFWTKARILEVYLNTVDWGTGLMGAEAAARAYFAQSANRLSPRQSALMAAVLPNPHRFSPVRPTAYIRSRAKRIMSDMGKMPILRHN